VFLNQVPDPNDPNKPYYSVGAPNPNTIGGFESYFVNWDNANPSQVEFQNANAQQTGVVFKQSNATATAKYKAHLASSVVTATGVNTQRKIVSDGCCSYAVYSSAGAIWFTKNSGSGWSSEVMLAPISSAKNPSISLNFPAGLANLHVVWENTVTDLFGNQCQAVFYRRSTNGGMNWENPIGFYTSTSHTYTAYGIDATPVVGGSPATVVWKYGNTSGGGFVMRVEPALNSSYYPVPNTFPSCRMPSVDGQVAPFKLVYENGGQIMYWEFSIDNNYNVTPIGSPTGISNEYFWMFNSTNPSISIAYPYVFVSWEADRDFEAGEEQSVAYPHRVFVRGYAPWVGWAPVTEFDYYGQTERNASVGIDLRTGYSKVNVAWDCSGGNVVKATRDISGVLWSGISVLGQGKYPAFNHRVDNTTQVPYAMYTSGSSLPYTVVLNNNFTAPFGQSSKPIAEGKSGSGPLFPTEAFDVRRIGSVRLDSITVGSFERGSLVGDLWIESAAFAIERNGSRERVLFSQDTSNFTEWLGTERIMIPQNAQRIVGKVSLALRNFAVRNRRVPGATKVLTTSFEVERHPPEIVKATILSDLRRFEGRDTIVSITVSISAAPLRGKHLRLRQQLLGQDEAQQPAWSELIRVDSSESSAPQRTVLAKTEQPTISSLPQAFALRASYPNPFNPSTTINFDLPEPSHVSFSIYDVLGRRVAELENGMKEVGYHSATWNASDVASGVYFARFTATDVNGNVKLSKVSKLILAK
jgi:hypothetical protein